MKVYHCSYKPIDKIDFSMSNSEIKCFHVSKYKFKAFAACATRAQRYNKQKLFFSVYDLKIDENINCSYVNNFTNFHNDSLKEYDIVILNKGILTAYDVKLLTDKAVEKTEYIKYKEISRHRIKLFCYIYRIYSFLLHK